MRKITIGHDAHKLDEKKRTPPAGILSALLALCMVLGFALVHVLKQRDSALIPPPAHTMADALAAFEAAETPNHLLMLLHAMAHESAEAEAWQVYGGKLLSWIKSGAVDLEEMTAEYPIPAILEQFRRHGVR